MLRQQVDTNIASAGQCTTTIEVAGLRTSSGSGEAVMRKLSSETGKVVISFTGPRETGRSSTGGWTTFSNSKCGYNQSLPAAGGPTPPLPWPGLIADTLGDLHGNDQRGEVAHFCAEREWRAGAVPGQWARRIIAHPGPPRCARGRVQASTRRCRPSRTCIRG